ncbi:amidase [Nocardioides marmoribigeumensis]|uniref:Amidase n=1 Tax=Nocardioides marmoribigeumensis TaxID=433649 RepID=A0ABU2BYP3_9ACTN|nr:amidase [Nocardioides marmoribigeumensis]MDR7363512.1 amidase [Nocardioides marmoribigeumensis]
MTRVHAFTDDVLADHDAVGLSALLRSREVGVLEAVDAAIARAEQVQPALCPVQHAAYDEARREAARLDRDGLGDEAFAGLPTFMKDNVDVEGMPTNFGSVAYVARPARHDGGVMKQWRGLGTVTLGKSRLPEFGLTASTEFLTEDPVRNPWHTGHSAGASSGGAAALVAAGVVPLAHANDGGGSIRIPAAACGLVGLKPTRGRLAAELADTVLPVQVVAQGAVSRTVRDTAHFLAAAERVRPARRGLRPVGLVEGPAARRLRIAVMTDSVTDIPTDDATRASVLGTADLLAAAGHELVEERLPIDPAFADDFALYWALLGLLTSRLGKVLYSRDFDHAQVDPIVKGLAAMVPGRWRSLPGAIRRLRGAGALYHEVFRRFDLVLTPTLGHVTPPIGHLGSDVEFDLVFERLRAYVGFTPAANVSGGPAITVPTGLGEVEGGSVPLSAMLSADHGQERTLLEVAYELEAARPFPVITG